jgi:hypothetical protein
MSLSRLVEDALDGGRRNERPAPSFAGDVDAALRFYSVLGRAESARSRSGHWIELGPGGAEFALHDAATADDGKRLSCVLLTFTPVKPLEAMQRRPREAGLGAAGDHRRSESAGRGDAPRSRVRRSSPSGASLTGVAPESRGHSAVGRV